MVFRGFLSMAVTLAIGLSAYVLWRYLDNHETRHYADIAEAESYAVRSELVRDLETQIRALRDVARFWDVYGHTERDQWGRDAQIELSHFEGIQMIVWSDPLRGIRYATTPYDLSLDRRPTDEEWASLQRLVADVDPSAGDGMLGPVANSDGHYSYRVQIPSRRLSGAAVLVTVVDAYATLEHLLKDRSPGYSVVVYWGEHELFRRGEAAPDIPDSWRREGLIQLSPGPVWRVVHAPTRELVESFSRPALPGLLAAGWIIAGLLGFLVYQNGKVRERALAAELAEQRLAALNEELENQVAERTRQLAEQAADLETLSESVSHDLRNPLNTIGLNVQLLRKTLGPAGLEPATRAIDQLDRASGRMTDILGRLQSFSQVSFARFQPELVDMAGMFREVFEELSFAEPPPPVSLTLNVGHSCLADRMLVRILILNLLSNAMKYTRGCSDRHIEVASRREGDAVTYVVRDNGVGFEPGTAEELFEPFKRGSDLADGQGVGLAIATRVVHRHGGSIWAEGSPGQGAVFYFELKAG